MSAISSVVRAIDVGYGHVKFSTGVSPDGTVLTDAFPSQSPIAATTTIDSPVMMRRDTHVVPWGEHHYEVGKSVAMAMTGAEESEVLDAEFPFSDAYRVRLYGALNYIQRSLPEESKSVINTLILGLPLTTFFRSNKDVSALFTGEHTINARGAKVTIGQCLTFPQPLGGFFEFLTSQPKGTAEGEVLLIDPGYNTVDYFICKGMVPNEKRSAAMNRGVSAVLRAAAVAYIDRTGSDASPSELIRLADRALTNKTPFKLCGKVVALNDFLAPGMTIVSEAVQAIKNAVGPALSIEMIVLSGGGASLYEAAVREKFPDHTVSVLPDSSHANVRGFHRLGERLAASANRARVQR